MKKIEAVILPVHLDAIQMELHRRGIYSSLTVMEVQHSDNRQGSDSNEKEGHGTFRRLVKLELMVDDLEAEKAVNAILERVRPESDEEGGHITVLQVNETLRIGRR